MQRIVKKIQQVTGNEKGVSLIEVVISIMLLGIISIVFVTLIGTSSKIQQQGNRLNGNSHTASSQLEGKDWNDVAKAKQEAEEAVAAGEAKVAKQDFVIQFGTSEADKKWTIPGYYLTGKDGEITYQLFVPDSTSE